jgi:drug/metabolite transporter (DMT)-like permease
VKLNFNTDCIPILAAGVLWGTMSPAGKQLALLNTDMLTLAFSRAVIMTLGAGLFIFLNDRRKFRIRGKQIPFLFLLSGLVIGGVYAAYFLALQHISVSLAVVLVYTYPLVTAFASAVIAREAPTKMQVIASLITLAGVGLATFSNLRSTGSVNLVGILWCSFTVLGLALFSVFGRLSAISDFLDQTTLFFYLPCFGILWMGLAKSITSGWGDILYLNPAQLIWILHISIVGSLLGYALYFIGLQRVTATTASIVTCFEIITAMVLSSVLLKQPPMMNEVFGAAMIIIAILMVSKRRKETGQPLEELAC